MKINDRRAWGLMGGGAASTLSAPDLYANNIYTTQIILNWTSGYDSYTVERSVNSDYSSSSVIYSGALATYTDTGRSADTTYYYRIKGTLSGVTSDWATGNYSTLAATPVGWYSVEGASSITTNSYGTITTSVISTWKNISGGAGPDFPVTAGGGIGATPIGARRFGVQGIVGGSYYTAGSDLTLSGDFCITLYVEPPQTASTCALLDNATNSCQARINTAKTSLQTKINSTSYDLLYPSALAANTIQKIVWKRVGNQASVSSDGGYTYGAAQTVSTADVTFNRFFATSAGGNNNVINCQSIIFFSQVLSGAQLALFFEPYKQATYTPAAEVTPSPKFTGNWNALSNGTTSDIVSVSDDGSLNWRNVWSKGNYAFIKATSKDSLPTASEQYLYIFNYLTGLVTDKKILPSYDTSAPNLDIHNQSSILLYDDAVWQVGHDIHYSTGGSSFNTFKVRKFVKGYDIRNYLQVTPMLGIPPVVYGDKGYNQFTVVSGRVFGLSQRWSGSRVDGAHVIISDDRLNSFSNVQLCTTTAGTWVYPYLIGNGTLTTMYMILLELEQSTSKYKSISLLKTSDGLTFSNIDNSYSFTFNSNSLVNLTTIITNCSIRNTTGDTAKNVPLGNAYIDASGFVYCIHGNGENTGWQVSYYNAGWQVIAVQFPAAQNVVLPPAGAGTNFNRVSPNVFKDDSDLTNNTFFVLALCDPSSDGNYRIGKFTTTDRFATQMTFVSYLSTDNTRKHWHLQPDFAYHFNTKAMIKGTQVNGTNGYLWMAKIKE